MKNTTKVELARWGAWAVYYMFFSIGATSLKLVTSLWVFIAIFLLGVAWVYIDKGFDDWKRTQRDEP